MKGFCCSAVLLPVIIIISTWSKEKSLWSDSLDLTSQPTEYARKQQIKTKQSWICIEHGFLELPNGSSYRPLVYIKFSPTTGRGAYCNSISGEGRFLTPRPYSMGLGLHFSILSEGDWGSESLAEIQMCPWRDMALCFLMTSIQIWLNPFRQRFDLNKLCREYNELNLKELMLERALDNV